MVVIVLGLPGSGKSYFASQFAGMINAEYINSDRERKKLLANSTYTEEEKLAVYKNMLIKMKQLLHQKKDLVLDATFYKDDIRQEFLREAKGDVDLILIEVRAEESVVRDRLKKPRSDSDADFEVYIKIKKQWEPLVEEHLVLFSTDNNILDMLQKAGDYMRTRNDKRANR
jgi:predicted kinase